MVQWLRFCASNAGSQGASVLSLFRDLRSHNLQGMAKKLNNNKDKDVINVKARTMVTFGRKEDSWGWDWVAGKVPFLSWMVIRGEFILFTKLYIVLCDFFFFCICVLFYSKFKK